MSQHSEEDLVRRYYDRNTGKFLRFARLFNPPAIHQPLYEHAGMSLTEALHTHHRLILSEIPLSHDPVHVLDLGCGVGESMLFLSGKTPENVSFDGITLSGEQAEMGRKYLASRNAPQRVVLHQGSFQAIPDKIPQADIAYAIEAFVHSPDAEQFFAEVHRILKPGGKLILIDDFLTDRCVADQRQKLLADLKAGWLAKSMYTSGELDEISSRHHLSMTESRDLTQMLSLNRPRDKAIHLIAPVARLVMKHSEYCRFLVGGDARQQGYKKDILNYRYLLFVKSANR